MKTPSLSPANYPLVRLRHHVTGAIERGEKTAIVGVPATDLVSATNRYSIAELARDVAAQNRAAVIAKQTATPAANEAAQVVIKRSSAQLKRDRVFARFGELERENDGLVAEVERLRAALDKSLGIMEGVCGSPVTRINSAKAILRAAQ